MKPHILNMTGILKEHIMIQWNSILSLEPRIKTTKSKDFFIIRRWKQDNFSRGLFQSVPMWIWTSALSIWFSGIYKNVQQNLKFKNKAICKFHCHSFFWVNFLFLYKLALQSCRQSLIRCFTFKCPSSIDPLVLYL